MIITIAKKEFTEIWRDGRFRWSGIIVLLLMASALGFGWNNYSRESREREAAQEFSRNSWIEQGDRNPHSAAHFGVYVYKQKTPLSFIDPGLDNYAGNTVWVEGHYRNPPLYRPIEDATSLQRFGDLTAASILLMLVPLLIIFLAFDSFAGEREKGTLRQTASLGVSNHSLVLGKIFGIGGALMILLLPVMVVALAALLFLTDGTEWIAELTRFALLCITYVLYFLVVFGLSLAVSAWARSSRMALIILLGFWVFGCLLIPRVSNDLAQTAYQTPSSKEFWDQVDLASKDGIDGHDPQNKRTKELEASVLAKYGVTKKEDLPINFSGISLQAGEEYSNTIYDKYYGDLEKTYFAQQNLQDMFGLVSPLMSARGLSMAFAGTDLRHHTHFLNKVEDYRRVMVKQLNDDLAYNSNPQTAAKYTVGKEMWEKTSNFDYARPDGIWSLKSQWLNIFILLIWAALSVMLAIVCAKRMKVV